MTKEKKKQSIVAGALTGSAGIFITKAIGLLYVIPFKSIAGDNTVFYSYAYTVYDYVLQICLSGMPYAIAALVSKYTAKDDQATVMLVRKVSKTVMMVFGVLSCIALILFSEPFARLVIPDGVTDDYITKTQTVIIIVSFALLWVPMLSYYRGFYQGLKEMKVYAFTQVLEQIIRVAFLLSASCILVYVFDMDQIWAAYMGVVSTSVSAIGTLIYFLFFDRRYMAEYKSDVVLKSRYTTKEIFKELMGYAIPYLVSAVFSYSSGFVLLLEFSTGMELYGTDPYLITTYQGIINYEANKLTSIPQAIGTGFALAVIPHISEALAKEHDDEVGKLVQKSLETINYLAVPLIIFMIFFSKEIYYVMYGSADIEYGPWIVMKYLEIQVLYVPCLALSSILVSLKMRKVFIILSIFQLVWVAGTLIPWLAGFGVNGFFICKGIEYLIFFIGAMVAINSKYKLGIKDLFKHCCYGWIGMLPMLIVVAVIGNIGFDITTQSRIITLIYGCVMGVLCLGLYALITAKLDIPQRLLGIDISADSIGRLVNKISRKEKKE